MSELSQATEWESAFASAYASEEIRQVRVERDAKLSQECADIHNGHAARLANGKWEDETDSQDDALIRVALCSSRRPDVWDYQKRMTDDARLVQSLQNMISEVRYEEQSKMAKAVSAGLLSIFGKEVCSLIASELEDD